MKNILLSAALVALLTAATSSAFAQQDGPPVSPAQSHGRPPHDDFMPPRGPGFAVVNDLEQLRRLYAMTGHEGDIACARATEAREPGSGHRDAAPEPC
jgi:hypothetical protein